MAPHPLKAAAGDTFITFLWVVSSSAIAPTTHLTTTHFSIPSLTLPLTLSLFALHIFLFDLIASALNGASFNPTGNAAFYAAGLPGDTPLSMAVRFPAQTAGAVAGVMTVVALVPGKYRSLFGGPGLMVDDMHVGAAAEVGLTFAVTLAVMVISLKGPKGRMTKAWMIAVVIVGLIVGGGRFTGPSMNPVNAYCWAYIDNRHNTWEQFYVYWLCPFIGAILAARVFRIIFPQPAPKAKKA